MKPGISFFSTICLKTFATIKTRKVLRWIVSRELSFLPACLHVILHIFQLNQRSKWKIHYLRTSSEFVTLPGEFVPINHVGSLYFLTDIRDNLNLMYTSSIIKCKLLICYKYPVFYFLCFTSTVFTTCGKYLRGNTVHSLCKFVCFVHIVVSVCFF